MIVKNLPRRCDTIPVSNFITYFSDSPLIIPNKYQREYAWARINKSTKKSALQVFLDDFYTAYTAGTDYNFVFGDNVCVAEDERINSYHLSDGQQRITSIFLLGIILSKLANKEDYLKRFFLEGCNNRDQLRLQHSVPLWNDYFRDTVLQEDDAIIPLVEAQEQIYEFINSKEDFDASKWFLFLWKHVFVNTIYIDQQYEDQYFNDVNDKGVGLDKVDKLKQYIIKRCSNEDYATEMWQDIVVSINKFGTVYLNCTKNSLSETLLSWALYLRGANDIITTKNMDKALENIHDMDSFLKWFKDMIDLGYTILAADSDFIPLKMVNKGNFIPAYITLVYKFKVPKRKAINYLFYRYLFEDLNNQNESSIFYKSLSANITINIDYSCMNKLTYKRGSNSKIKAFLCMLEYKFNPNIFKEDLSAKNITIEHISSQSWKEEDFHNIGNLTLLTKTENSKLNKNQEKHPIYKNSKFNITKCLCKEYIPIDDELRLFRSKHYCKGYSSQDLDAFDVRDFNYRKEQLLDCLVKILELDINN